MAQPLVELIEQFCTYQRKQRGKQEGGVRTYRWNLNHFLRFVRTEEGRPARVEDVSAAMIQAWMDAMARDNPALSTLRTRQSTVSSLAAWMVKRGFSARTPWRRWTGRHTAASPRLRCPAQTSWTR